MFADALRDINKVDIRCTWRLMARGNFKWRRRLREVLADGLLEHCTSRWIDGWDVCPSWDSPCTVRNGEEKHVFVLPKKGSDDTADC